MMLRSSKVVGLIELETSKASRRVSGKEKGLCGETKSKEADHKLASGSLPKQVKSSSLVSRVFKHFQDYLRHVAVISLTAAAVIMACSLRGDLALVAIFLYKSYLTTVDPTIDQSPLDNANDTANESVTMTATSLRIGKYDPLLPDYLQLPDSYNMKDLLFFVGIAVTSSQIMYQAVCGFFQLYFYTLKRDSPEEWKCQPHRFLTRSNEIHEIVVGTTNMTIAGTISGFITCWVVNGNYSTVYFDISEYGYLYFFSSFVIIFLWIEAMAFYSHALLHTPWFYRNCHKQHHRYHSPTAYSVVALSPFELVFYDSLILSPLFLFPIHGLPYVSVLVYVYYFGMMDHSGIKMTSWFPWQPDTMFHDDHHKYFHVNFGFNSTLFDRIHGTLRQSNREYGEDVFWGKGREKK
ncbi:methylsterol monooxygenase 1-like [Halichondria panicea]|uniref:methylsterol monooxygenase 1-like n=1 Tax=Halichondria panicea TaxID=6063 RepID=UPI00312B3DBC